jgi:S-DNA-T family DNA segregation ATPase FtsK/SpoIIIE
VANLPAEFASPIPGSASGKSRLQQQLCLGIQESDLQAFALPAMKQTCAYIFGDPASGKSNALRLLIREILRQNTAETAAFLILDPKRSLLGEIPDGFAKSYFTNPEDESWAATITEIGELLKSRRPGDDVSRKELLERSFWQGPDLYILIDDYDIAAPDYGTPLESLAALIPSAADIGLHIFLTCRNSVAVTKSSDPVLKRLKQLGHWGILLPGSPEVGPLIDSLKPELGPPGRARIVSGSSLEIPRVQLAWVPEAEE